MEQALQASFTPEFLGRLDALVHFSALDDCAMQAIAQKYLTALTERVAAMGIQLRLPDSLAEHLCKQCKGRDGARHLRRLIQKEVEGPLAVFLLSCDCKPLQIQGCLENSEIEFNRTDV